MHRSCYDLLISLISDDGLIKKLLVELIIKRAYEV